MPISMRQIAQQQQIFLRNALAQYEKRLVPSMKEDEEFVRRAVFSVRNQYISIDNYNHSTQTLNATVQDVSLTKVTIHFQNAYIFCSCPQPEICRHKLAVLLSLYQHIGSVQDWANKWRAQKTVSLNDQITARTPESWQAVAEEIFSYHVKSASIIPYYTLDHTLKTIHQKLSYFLPFEREWQPIYEIFMELTILSKVESHIDWADSDHAIQEIVTVIERRCKKIEIAMKSIATNHRLFAFDPFYHILQQKIHAFLLSHSGIPMLKINLYILFWQYLFHEKKRYEEELKQLEQVRVQEGLPLYLVKAIFYLLLDHKALLQKVGQRLSPDDADFLFYITEFALAKELYDVKLLLQAFAPHIHEAIHNRTEPRYRKLFADTLVRFYNKFEWSHDEWMAFYTSLGQYGLHTYANYLLQQKQYKYWIALYQMYPTSIAYLEDTGLKEIFQKNPALTLPLYHFYALLEIEQKSRMNYKQAVRIWKAMKRAAKKAGKLTYWHEYMQTVRQQFKRLRALQEEIDKSNLLS